MLKIIVCLKQIPDPEAPTSSYTINESSKQVILKGVPPVINPFDENALEAALRIKDTIPANITVISLGTSLSKSVLRKVLAAGADNLILIQDPAFHDLDSVSTATLLSMGISQISNYDLVLTGRQSADWNVGMVGLAIAEKLGLPSISTAREIEVVDKKIIVHSVVSDGYRIIVTDLPALVTVSNELGELRTPPLKQLMAAQKKPITVWDSIEMKVDTNGLGKRTLHSLALPKNEIICEFVDGVMGDEIGTSLALKMKEKGIL